MRRSEPPDRTCPTRPAAIMPMLAAVLLTGAVACASLFDAPDVRIANVGVRSVGLSGATADVVLQVSNPNGFGLTAEGLRYQLDFRDPEVAEDTEASWQMVTSGRTTDRIQVPANDSSAVTVEVPFRYEELGRAMISLLRDGELNYRLSGDVTFDAPVGDVRVPFRDTGRLGL